jgi:Nickel/cobalt transporter regulator
MQRTFAIVAILALAVPSMAMAAPKGKGGPGGGHPTGGGAGAHLVTHGPVGHGPVGHATAHVVVHTGGPHLGVVHPGPGVGHPGLAVGFHGAPFMFHNHPYAWHQVHYPHPWIWPAGYAYQLWTIGAILPPLFWSTPTYYYTDWATMGLPPPDPGTQYIEYGQDLLLVNTATGQVIQVFPGAFN